MSQLKRPIEQTDPPRSARDTLPTMYDLEQCLQEGD